MAPPKGYKHTDEEKAKMKGRVPHNKGKHLSQSWKDALSESHKDKHPTQEHKDKISVSLSNKPKTPEHVEKVRQSHLGKKRPASFSQTMKEVNKLRGPVTDITRKRLSESRMGEKNPRYGKTASLDHRIRMVEAAIGGFWYGAVRYREGPQYCEKWTEELKERVRTFFGHRCLLCEQPQNGTALHVHHVWYNKKACCDDTPRSLVPLCNSCHSITTTGDRDYWSNYIQEFLDIYYDGKCWLTKDEYRELYPKSI
jgi:hypothetical protein